MGDPAQKFDSNYDFTSAVLDAGEQLVHVRDFDAPASNNSNLDVQFDELSPRNVSCIGATRRAIRNDGIQTRPSNSYDKSTPKLPDVQTSSAKRRLQASGTIQVDFEEEENVQAAGYSRQRGNAHADQIARLDTDDSVFGSHLSSSQLRYDSIRSTDSCASFVSVDSVDIDPSEVAMSKHNWSKNPRSKYLHSMCRESRLWDGTQSDLFHPTASAMKHIQARPSWARSKKKNKRLRWVFEMLDEDGSGNIDVEEFIQFGEKMKLDLGEAELRRVFQKIDVRQEGMVSISDFFRGYRYNGLVSMIVNLAQCGKEFKVSPDYDYTKDTSENYKQDDLKFHGEFKDLRSRVDYGYHNNYTKKRQLWQDGIVKRNVCRLNPQVQPWIVYTCGPMGVGKGYALSWMSEQGYFPLENLVHIDPDHFKLLMPEWEGYVKANAENAGGMCHKESSFIQEIAQEVALMRNQNIWVDGSLRNTDWFSIVLKDIRERFPMYKLAIFIVEAEEQEIRNRIQKRGEETGRFVPEQMLASSLMTGQRALNKLLPLCDFCARIDNSGDTPRLMSFETIDRSGNWAVLKNQFQTQSSIRDFPDALAPLLLNSTPLEMSDFSYEPSELKFEADLEPHPITLTRNLSEYDVEANATVFLSPLDRYYCGTPKKIIPADTIYIAFAYPLIDHKLKIDDNISMFCQYGGFICFDHKRSIIAVIAISKHWKSTMREFIPFEKPFRWKHEWTLKIANRFRRVTIPLMQQRGARWFAYVTPREDFGPEYKATQFGGFVYLFHESVKIAPHDMDCYFPIQTV